MNETNQKLQDVFDSVVAASQDPNNHPAFEQLRNHLRENQPRVHTEEEATEKRENLRQIEAINALEGIKPSPELRELTERVIRGEVTAQDGFEQMKQELFIKYNISLQTE